MIPESSFFASRRAHAAEEWGARIADGGGGVIARGCHLREVLEAPSIALSVGRHRHRFTL